MTNIERPEFKQRIAMNNTGINMMLINELAYNLFIHQCLAYFLSSIRHIVWDWLKNYSELYRTYDLNSKKSSYIHMDMWKYWEKNTSEMLVTTRKCSWFLLFFLCDINVLCMHKYLLMSNNKNK